MTTVREAMEGSSFDCPGCGRTTEMYPRFRLAVEDIDKVTFTSPCGFEATWKEDEFGQNIGECVR
jgi:hypothetical protein